MCKPHPEGSKIFGKFINSMFDVFLWMHYVAITTHKQIGFFY